MYERKIGSVRRAFEGALSQLGLRKLSFDEFSTLMQEAASVVNHTPMCEVSSDPRDPMPITPAALLSFNDVCDGIPLENFDEKDILSYGAKRYRRVQYLSGQFWTRWRRDYITQLSRRYKWKLRKQCISKEDVVLLREKSSKRSSWPVGVVVGINLSKDKLVRSVKVKLPPLKGSKNPRYFLRSIHELIMLVKSVDNSTKY